MKRFLPLALVLPVLAASLPQAKVSITKEGDTRVIKSNGLPDHKPGDFPRRGNPNAIAAQSYTFRSSMKPKAAAEPKASGHAFFGVAVNGVPFEPGTAEYWNFDPDSGWKYEAMSGKIDLGLDDHNAHVQPNGSYHYHGLPVGLIKNLGGDEKKMTLIGYAADGFPIYTQMAHSDANDAKSPLKKMRPSYQVKKGGRPGGPGGTYDGTFTQDWEYVAGSGDLDECNGRIGVTPEYPQGTFYYCVTAEFPQLSRLWKGEADSSFQKGPPGGGMRGGPPGQGRGRRGGPGGPGGRPGPGQRPGPPPSGERLEDAFLPRTPF